MKEQLISSETAKLAKERGFKNQGRELKPTITNCNILDNTIQQTCEGFSPLKDLPTTQSLLQKWLREVHNIDIFLYYKARFEDTYLYNYTLVNRVNLCKKSLNYNSYEEALEVGLQEALKLIPNNK